MKKLILILSGICCASSFALQTVDLSQQKYTCNKITLTPQTSESTLQANCKQVHYKDDTQITSGQNAGRLRGSDQIYAIDPDPTMANLVKVWFYTDDGTMMKCYYRNNTLVKCKVKESHSKAASTPQAK